MPTLETINVGQAPNDKKGDPLRNAMQKVVLNFSTLNTAIQGVLDGKGQANGYASLDGNGRLVAAQAPIVYAPALPTAGHDLNDYITPGVWYQTTIAGATAGANYPTVNVGFLEVVATGTPVLQVYTTRTATVAAMQRFWRVRMSATSWSVWKELSDATTAFNYQGGLASGVDLNSYTQRGMWAQGSSAGAAAGSNYPIAQSGTLIVYSTGYPGGAAATGCSQIYLAANSNRLFFRTLVGTTWTPWDESVRTSLLGAASGVAQLGSDSRLLPAQAPILYSTAIPGGTDANAMIVPGAYYVNSDAAATPELNWPERLAGQLTVEMAITGNAQVTQVYTTRNGTGGVSRTYKRVRFGTGGGTWGAWQQLARYDDAMTHTYLTAATDANTLIGDNTFYTWTAAAVWDTNFPPHPVKVGGMIQTYVLNTGNIVQIATLNAGGSGRAIVFQRQGNGGPLTWTAWRLMSPLTLLSQLPTANAGDAYVDGVGWHAWNGTAYALTSLATVLPTAAHDLNNYVTPGSYRQTTNAGATAGSNYPSPLSGYMEVVQGVTGSCKQEYTISSASNVSLAAGPRKFWRMQTGASTWSPWQEVLAVSMGLTQQTLAAAADANTLNAVNTQYVWTNGAVVSGGTNWPALGWASARGFLEVVAMSGTQVYQRLTLLLAASVRPVVYERYGSGSTWYGWRIAGPVSSTSYLPTADYGDVYVDGLGWYAWDGSAYVLTFAGRDHGQCRFQYVSATQCRLVPYNGNGLLINGRQQRIPAAGVNIANTAVTVGSTMYVYAYMNGTVMTLEASTAAPVADSNGIMTKTGDVGHTLVGMVARSGDGNFYDSSTQRYVASWFNQRRTRGYQYANPVTSSDTYVTLSAGIACLVWAGNIIDWNFSGQTSSGVRSGSYIGVQVNGAGSGGGFGYSLLAGSQMAFSFGGSFAASAHGLYSISAVGQGAGPAGSVSWAYEQTTSCDI